MQIIMQNKKNKFEDSFNENEFLAVPEALEAVNMRIVSLLTSVVKSRK